jgi:putative membrane protein
MKIINRIILIVGSIVIVWGPLLVLDSAFAQEGRYGGWHMGPGMMGGWGMGWFGMIFSFAIWIAIIAAIVFFVKWLIQSLRGDTGLGTGSSGALEILKERYARGDIDKAQFESMKRAIAN